MTLVEKQIEGFNNFCLVYILAQKERLYHYFKLREKWVINEAQLTICSKLN